MLIYLARNPSPGFKPVSFSSSLSVSVGEEPPIPSTTYTHFDRMLGSSVLVAALVAGASAACTKRQYAPDEVDKLAKASMPKLKEWLAKNPQGGCTLETAIRRRE